MHFVKGELNLFSLARTLWYGMHSTSTTQQMGRSSSRLLISTRRMGNGILGFSSFGFNATQVRKDTHS